MTFNNPNPQLTYYIMLYLLTVLLRVIRAYNSRPTSSDPKEIENYK